MERQGDRTHEEVAPDAGGYGGEAGAEGEEEEMPAAGPEGPEATRPTRQTPPMGRIGTINGLPWGEYLAREYAEPRRIALYDVGGGGPYAGLIAPAKSGYRWRQQTSGLLCAQRELEGIYVPLPDPTLGRELEALHVGCCQDTLDDREASDAYRAAHPEEVARSEAWTREHWPELAALRDALAAADRPLGITPEEADQLDTLLRSARLPLRVARERLARSTEAWVWVRVAGDVAAWDHEFARGPTTSQRQPSGAEAGALPEPTGYRFQWMLAALSGTQDVLTWQSCD